MKTIRETSDEELEAESKGFDFRELLRAFFKHKGKLIFFTLLGIGGAVAIYFLRTPQYESASKIFVRYVEEISNVDPIAEDGRRTATMDSVINAEIEILRSWDLANAVVDEITPAVIVGDARIATRMEASRQLLKGLEVDAPKGGRVITVTFRHSNPEVVVRALTTLVRLYQEKHVDIHRATKSRETSRSRRAALTLKVADLTERIEQLKAESGVSSLNDAATGLNKRADELRSLISAAETDYEEQKAQVSELKRMGLVTEATTSPKVGATAPAASTAADHRAHSRYQSLLKRLSRAEDEEANLSLHYSGESSAVKEARRKVSALEAERLQLETDNPKLLAVAQGPLPGVPVQSNLDPMMETIRLATLKARVEFLRKREMTLKDEMTQFAGVSRKIHELERERDLQSEGLRHFAASFQRTEFETPLTADQYDNIVVVQGSSPPVLALTMLTKILCAVGFGGFAFGLALVVFMEFVLNRSVKGSLDLETRTGVPLMLNIPHFKNKGVGALLAVDGKEGLATEIEPWTGAHFVRPYAEAIRDRLILYFEQIGLTRKPKLVGVTGYSRGAGVSTIASGIAATLSEVGDGKVLLVDMNANDATVHPFFGGKPSASLLEALESGGKSGFVAENLCLATVGAEERGRNGRGSQLFPKRFYDLIPNFQASDFDYIIFDMPPLAESSLPLAMAGYLDKTILVVEADRDSREAVRRAGVELLNARASLSGVLNKTRQFGPKWLQEA